MNRRRYRINRYTYIVELNVYSLAVYRTGIGFLILIDLLVRSRDLVALYSDQGLMPRHALTGQVASTWQWSLHLANGTPGFQRFLFCFAGIVAVALTVGYRSKLAAFASWLLLVSLHSRNPLILNAGDTYLAILTFWGIFLPLGAVWSADAKLALKRDQSLASGQQLNRSIFSLATFALCMQVVVMYTCTGILKYRTDAWHSGSAIQLALSKDYIVTSFGQYLSQHSALLEQLTHATVYFEIFGSFVLLLSRGWFRVAMVAIFILFHLGLALCFSIGLFPYVCMVAFLAFLPGTFWDYLFKESKEPTKAHKSVQRSTRFSKPTKDELRIWQPRVFARLAQQAVILMALIIVLWSNVKSLGLVFDIPDALRNLGTAFRWNQSWRMFVNLTETDNGWYVFHAQYADGTSRDLLTDVSPVTYERPELVSATFKSARWRKFCTNLRKKKYKAVRPYFGDYVLRQRENVHHDVDEMVGLEISYLRPQPVGDDTAESHPLEVVAFDVPYATSEPLKKTVLYEWRNNELQYPDNVLSGSQDGHDL